MTSEIPLIPPPTNQPTTSHSLDSHQATADGCSMDVDESPSLTMMVEPSKNDNDDPNVKNHPTASSSSSSNSHGHEKPMLNTEMTDGRPKVTTKSKKDGYTVGGKIEKPAYALLTGLYEVRSS
jgi:hypothetical protein